jgi:hypothetical protein
MRARGVNHRSGWWQPRRSDGTVGSSIYTKRLETMSRPPSRALPHHAPIAGAPAFAPIAVAVLLVLLLVAAPRLRDELRFFAPGSLVAADGSAPVPQDDADIAALDAAFRAAAARLPLGASCVIGLHAWHRDYFRAAYLLLPRRVVPAVEGPSSPITGSIVSAALHAHHASCLLLGANLTAPAGYRRLTSCAYSLFIQDVHDSRAATADESTRPQPGVPACGSLPSDRRRPGPEAIVTLASVPFPGSAP